MSIAVDSSLVGLPISQSFTAHMERLLQVSLSSLCHTVPGTRYQVPGMMTDVPLAFCKWMSILHA